MVGWLSRGSWERISAVLLDAEGRNVEDIWWHSQGPVVVDLKAIGWLVGSEGEFGFDVEPNVMRSFEIVIGGEVSPEIFHKLVFSSQILGVSKGIVVKNANSDVGAEAHAELASIHSVSSVSEAVGEVQTEFEIVVESQSIMGVVVIEGAFLCKQEVRVIQTLNGEGQNQNSGDVVGENLGIVGGDSLLRRRERDRTLTRVLSTNVGSNTDSLWIWGTGPLGFHLGQ